MAAFSHLEKGGAYSWCHCCGGGQGGSTACRRQNGDLDAVQCQAVAQQKEGILTPRSFQDYEIIADLDNLPEGVSVEVYE